MKAVIIAGGESLTMKPLTCAKPASMLKICGVPLVEYAFRNLERCGFSDVIIAADRFADRIAEYYDDGRKNTPALSVTSAGTQSCEAFAKAVKEYDIPEDENIIAVRGDMLADIDFREMLSFHRQRNADVTVAVKENDTSDGVAVVTDGENVGKVKQCFNDSCFVSDRTIAGAIIIKAGYAAGLEDKGGDLFTDGVRSLVEDGLKVSAFEVTGYCKQVVYPEDMIVLARDVMDGRYPYCPEGVLRSDDGRLKGVNAEYPVYIGRNTAVADGVHLSAYTMLGDNVFVGRNASLKGCTAGDGCYIGESAKLNGCCIGDSCRISSEACVFEGCSVGDRAVIGSGAVINAGAKIWSGRRIEAFAEVREDIRYGNARKFTVDDDGIAGEINASVTPKTAAAAGSAAASLGRRIVLGYRGGKAAAALAMAAASGISAAGSEVWYIGEATEPEFVSGIRISGADGGCFIDAGASARIKFFSGDGLSVTGREIKLIEAGLNRGAYRRTAAKDFGEIHFCSGIKELYLNRLVKSIRTKSEGIRLVVNTPSGRSADISRRLVELMNDRNGEAVVFHISGDGTKVSAYTEETGYVSQEKLIMLWCAGEFAQGKNVILPASFPQAADALAKRYGCKVLRYLHCSDGSDSDIRRLASESCAANDGFALMVRAAEYLSLNRSSLKEACDSLPCFASVSRYVAVDRPAWQSMRLVGKMDGECAFSGDGAVLSKGGGRLLVRPVRTGRGLMIFAESHSMEAASELCDNFQDRIRALEKTEDRS